MEAAAAYQTASLPPTRSTFVFAALAAANVLAWLWAWFSFHDHPALLGTALLAYMLGVRHAFDADHIAAIDNVVRNLIERHESPQLTGLYFAMGHSTVVFAATAAIITITHNAAGPLRMAQSLGGSVGAIVSTGFLLGIGLVNFFVLRDLLSSNHHDPRHAAKTPGPAGGIMTRLFRRLFRSVRSPWHMYPLGFLFGLGFDTASEIALFGISAATSGQGIALLNILCLPVLFASGMSIADLSNSVMMSRVYNWARRDMDTRRRYNVAMTSVSVGLALGIGLLQAASATVKTLELNNPVATAILGFADSMAGGLGIGVTGLFVVLWAMMSVRFAGR